MHYPPLHLIMNYYDTLALFTGCFLSCFPPPTPNKVDQHFSFAFLNICGLRPLAYLQGYIKTMICLPAYSFQSTFTDLKT